MRRVVISGLGIVSPVGSNVSDSWNNIVSGVSGIKAIDSFDCQDYSTNFAGVLADFNPLQYFSSKDIRKFDPFVIYGGAAATQAIDDSGILESKYHPNRVGVIIGSGTGGLSSIQNSSYRLRDEGCDRVSPFFVPGSIINIAAGYVSIKYGFKGANLSISTACASGSHSIGIAARLIACGDADVIIAGGSEAPICEIGLAGFMASRALSKRNDSPELASRPWDKNRDGFVLGEGAGILVLEEYEHAVKRGAKIYAELGGFAATADAYHITSPAENAASSSECIHLSLQDAKLNSSDIQYINAHGTSTIIGDLVETRAIKNSFRDYTKIAVSSTKSMTGHLLGAAGAIEAIFSVLAIQHNIAPPTINLDCPSEGCNLNYVAHTAQELKIDAVLSNSFGFGGTNCCLIFKRFVSEV